MLLTKNKGKDLRIGIVGAGAGGLTAAYFLKKIGYKQVVVFEKQKEVGGKCLSFEYEGKHYDLGFHEMAAGYDQVINLAKEVGVKSESNNILKIYNRFLKEFLSLKDASAKEGHKPLQVLIATVKYWWLLLTKYNHFSRPDTGFANVPKDLCQPLSTWAKANNLQALSVILEYIVKIQGYGRLDENSAAYFVKFQGLKNWFSISLAGIGLTKRWPRMFPEGSQQIWKNIAKRVDVRLETQITSIKRTLKGDDVFVDIYIEGQKEPMEFDYLILACPLDLKSLSFMKDDLSEQEKTLFSKFDYVRFYSTACEVQGIPQGIVGTVPLTSIGGYTGYIKDYKEKMSVYYSIGHNDQDGEEIIGRIKKMTAGLPVTQDVKPEILKVHLQKEWFNFFPHVSPMLIAEGYYDQLESLQGQRKTFYCTSLFSMELLSHVVGYTKRLIFDQFPPLNQPSESKWLVLWGVLIGMILCGYSLFA